MEFLRKLSNFSSFFDSPMKEDEEKIFHNNFQGRMEGEGNEEKLFESIYVVFMLKFTRSIFSPFSSSLGNKFYELKFLCSLLLFWHAR